MEALHSCPTASGVSSLSLTQSCSTARLFSSNSTQPLRLTPKVPVVVSSSAFTNRYPGASDSSHRGRSQSIRANGIGPNSSNPPACEFGPWDPQIGTPAVPDPSVAFVEESFEADLDESSESDNIKADDFVNGALSTSVKAEDHVAVEHMSDVDEVDDGSTTATDMEEAGVGSWEHRMKAMESLAEGLMPPWEQEGLMKDVSGLSVDALVSADAVYNKELSWLAFNWRVLYQAMDKRTPLMERLRFLAITARNLDEFFCKRVGALKRQQAVGMANLIGHRSSWLWTPSQSLKIVAREVEQFVQMQLQCLQQDLLPSLRKHGISIVHWDELESPAKDKLRAYYRAWLEPIITPLAVDPGHPFPFIGNMSLGIAVALRDPVDDDHEFAIVSVPNTCNRWHPLVRPNEEGSNEERNTFISVEEIIKANLRSLFGGMEITSAHFFRVTRNADVERNEDEAEDLLEMITDEMRERKFAPFVRLEVDCEMPEEVLLKLSHELGLDSHDDVYRLCGPLGLGEIDTIPVNLDENAKRELVFSSWAPQTHPRLKGADIFDTIRHGDVLVHHPYHSFGTSTQHFVEAAARDPKVSKHPPSAAHNPKVSALSNLRRISKAPYHSFGTSTQHFVEAAALDPKVQAIKATLYRTSADSPVISALIKAAEYGKQVAVLVELKARFDEARNVGFAQKLESAGCCMAYGLVGLGRKRGVPRGVCAGGAILVSPEIDHLSCFSHTFSPSPRQNAGCHVAYGLVGLKTHCKCIMVVREEEEGFRTYVHIGTGNYNPRTASVYTDFGLFSCRPELGEDVRDLFKYLTGYHRQNKYNRLLVAPGTMRREFLRLIDREIANAAAGLPAHVVIKCNGLDDEVMVAKIYEAVGNGVKVDCIVRGMCRLRPGVPGVSENLRVVSIIGRFLEHHRIFKFENGGDPQYYIGSADWMSRNLTRRVEVVTPVEDRAIKSELQSIIDACLFDKRQAWQLQPDGRYRLMGVSQQWLSAQGGKLPKPSKDNKLHRAEHLGLHQAIMDLTLRRVIFEGERWQWLSAQGGNLHKPSKENKLHRAKHLGLHQVIMDLT
ncbi:unnamed protein product [Closterium sp. NIES-65]|nr:unnamed protein product [Closterium sp. NIES-65]